MTAPANLETDDLFARVACGIDGSEASIGTVRQVANLVAAGAAVTLFGVANEDAAVSIGWPGVRSRTQRRSRVKPSRRVSRRHGRCCPPCQRAVGDRDGAAGGALGC